MHQTQAKQAEGICVKWEEELSSEADVLINPPEWGGRRDGEGVLGSWEGQSSVYIYTQTFLTPPCFVVGHHPSPGYSRNEAMKLLSSLVKNVITFYFHSRNEHCILVYHFRGPYVSNIRIRTVSSLCDTV